MTTNKAQKPWLYFSDTVDPSLKNKVLSIADQGCDQFETATLGFAETEATVRSRIKLMAWKDEENGSWIVDKITTHETAAGSIPAPKETVMRGACFFDALYFAAYFEKTEKDMGAQVMAMPEKMPHFRAAAEAAGQPFDSRAMPHPAYRGKILTNGSFDANAYEVAARTETIKPAVLTPQQKTHNPLIKNQFKAALARQGAHENKSPAAVIAQEEAVLARIEAKEKSVAAYKKALQTEGDVLQAFVKNLSDFKFINDDDETSISNFILCLITLGAAIPVINLSAPNRYNAHVIKRINRAAQAACSLPEGPAKTLLEEFNKNARFTLYAEQAARQVQNCVDKGKPVKARRKSFKNIEKAAKELDLAPAEVQKLKADFLQQVYKPGDFYDLLKKQWDEGEIQPEIKKSIKALEQGMTP